MWGIDLGTTNTGLACYESDENGPKIVQLDKICRRESHQERRDDSYMIPSSIEVLEKLDFWGRVGKWGPLNNRFRIGQQAIIGQEAINKNLTKPKPNFISSFKRQLAKDPHQTIGFLNEQPLSARYFARTFVRELIREVESTRKEKIRELTFTVPVDSYETYRKELAEIAKSLKINEVHFLDEPVAAAVGYGLSLHRPQKILVVDFGGGTLDLAIVAIEPRTVENGKCEVIAKSGRPIGGRLVDKWISDHIAAQLGLRDHANYPQYWQKLMQQEACRVKESLFLRDEEVFVPVPPRPDIPLKKDAIRFSKEDLLQLLEEHELVNILAECTDEVMQTFSARGIDQIDEILMVGGSTLLPRIYPYFEERFGRERVRAWQPFEAVVLGASVFAAGKMQQLDFIVHDYAFVTHDIETHEAKHSIIIPQGTRFPTKPDFWKQRVTPTCSLGEPEKIFKLVISEIGQSRGNDKRFVWDAEGQLHKLGEGENSDVVIVPLNSDNPTLGILKPPHHPSDKSSRLEISFGVNADRWLCATVLDLHTNKVLMKAEPVVRLI